jgi:CheY-like chemotaxis protein
VREKEGLSYSTFSSFNASAFDEAGSFRIGAIFAPQNRSRVEQAIREELARAVRDGFSAEEVKAGKQALLEQRRMARTQDRALANRLSSYLFMKRTFAWDVDFEAKIAAPHPGAGQRRAQAPLRSRQALARHRRRLQAEVAARFGYPLADMAKGPILLLEDSPDLRVLLERRPRAGGLRGADRGGRGRRPASWWWSARPQLIIADIQLPYMSGDEFVAALRADPAVRDIPVIFLSVDARPRGAREAPRRGGVLRQERAARSA